jgi:hypothetical protein
MLPMQARCIILSVLISLVTCTGMAQNSNCGEIGALARMARSRSVSALDSAHRIAEDSYRARLVFATRQFELNPTAQSAADELLKLIPVNDNEQLVAATFGGFLCEGEPVSDVQLLSALGDRIAHDFSRAILLVHEKMDAYVVYAAEAVQDPHSDYALQMVPVCRARHRAFVKAVENLGAGAPEKGHFATASTDWFKKHILDPDNCRALAIPEAD